MDTDTSKTAIIVQARSNSTRLPNKVLLPFFENRSILELLIEKIQENFQEKLILATSTNPSDDAIENLAKKLQVTCFRGDENLVINRFIDAAENQGVEKIIRVCSDNPFLSMKALKELLDNGTKSEADYLSFRFSSGLPSILSHSGLFAEYVTKEALEKVTKLTKDATYMEHVTNYIYTNPDHFRIQWLPIPEYIDGKMSIRLTLDTAQDFELLSPIYKRYVEEWDLNSEELINFIESQAELKTKMLEQIEVNTK